MNLIGEKWQGIREVRFYLAKLVPDLARNEPRNCGLIVRLAESKELYRRFMEVPPVALDEYRTVLVNWEAAIEKHGTRCLHFIGKRDGNKYANPALYIELAASRMVAGRVNFDEAYKRLVLPEGGDHG
jgi:hypothetical protein